MNILDKIFGRKELNDGIALDDLGELVAEACALKDRQDSRLSAQEIAYVAIEMEVDPAFLEQAFIEVQKRARLKQIKQALLVVAFAAITILLIYSWWNRPVITEGNRSLLEAGLDEIQLHQ